MSIFDSSAQDLRFACRALRRAKPFAGAAVLTLALGIAGTTVMFTLIQGVLLRPLPVHEQDRLIVAWKELPTSGSARYPFGNTEIEALADASQLLERVAGVTRNAVGRSVVTDDGVSSYANVGLVTGGFFDVLGVEPILGRALTLADEKQGAENVVVVSSGLWRGRYGGSHEVLGQRLTLDEQLFTIVGVMPRDLDYPTGVDIWRTTSSVPTSGPFGDAARREVNLVASRRRGVRHDLVEPAGTSHPSAGRAAPPRVGSCRWDRGLVLDRRRVRDGASCRPRPGTAIHAMDAEHC